MEIFKKIYYITKITNSGYYFFMYNMHIQNNSKHTTLHEE